MGEFLGYIGNGTALSVYPSVLTVTVMSFESVQLFRVIPATILDIWYVYLIHLIYVI